MPLRFNISRWWNLIDKCAPVLGQTNSRCETPSWTPPPLGTVFTNVDVVIFQASRHMGVGVLIRDHNDNCLLAGNELIPRIVLPENAEAMAIRRALTLARDEGFPKVIVASDCLSAIQRIHSIVKDCSEVVC